MWYDVVVHTCSKIIFRITPLIYMYKYAFPKYAFNLLR